VGDYSLSALFKKIPRDSIQLPLTVHQRKVLLEAKEVELPAGGGDTASGNGDLPELCTLDTLSENYMHYTSTFISNDNGFSNWYTVTELKKFKKKDGSYIVVLEHYGASPNLPSEASEIKVYDVKDGTLTENKNNLLPKHIDVNEYFSTQIPTNIRNSMKDAVSDFVSFWPKEPNKLSYDIDFEKDDYDKWLKTYSIEFTWDGEKFIKKIIPKQ